MELWPRNGLKTVYFKVRNAVGESAVMQDVITLKEAPPVVKRFQLNSFNKERVTTSPKVQLTYECSSTGGKPAYYRVSESPVFTGATWTPLDANSYLYFMLSAGAGEKTVYFQMRNGGGMSARVSDTITLKNWGP
jgi:hypothetical protein